ncbi:hypothetical protein [Muricoccus aerilatus]|uniref:hypothetical protein n=1 Tax=Muricoccus aerilatus TaxID=452982 RepID=UPI000ACF9BB7|nr:hypothetical protein [Roseomonas aerilata]
MLSEPLGRGLRALVLTYAMRPMSRHAKALAALNAAHSGRLTLCVSLDHHTPVLHNRERGAGTFAVTIRALEWLARHSFRINVAGRGASGREPEAAMPEG